MTIWGFQGSDQNCKGFYAIIWVVISIKDDCIFSSKSSKEACGSLECKYNEDNNSVVEESVSW